MMLGMTRVVIQPHPLLTILIKMYSVISVEKIL